MKHISLLWGVMLTSFVSAHAGDVIPIDEEHFPDLHFRNYISNNIDNDNSGSLDASEIDAVASMNLYMDFIENLKGIEYFTNLTLLNCSSNYLVALDLSKNTKLKTLNCEGNQRTLKEDVTWDGFSISEIDMTRVNPNTVYGAKIVDGKFVPNNKNTIAYDYATGLTGDGVSSVRIRLSFSIKPLVRFIDIDGKVISEQYVTKGSAATAPSAPKHEGFTFNKWSEAFDEVTYDTDVYALYDVVSGGVADKYKIAIDATNFPDENFRDVVSGYDKNADGYLNTAELYAVTEMNVMTYLIKDIKGIEYFTELRYLNINSNQITAVDVSKNTKLTSFSCVYNKLTSLDLSQNTLLRSVFCSNNEIENLVLPKDNQIHNLEIENNKIKEVDVASMPYLTSLLCSGNSIVSLSDFNVESTQSDHSYSSSFALFSGKDNVRDLGDTGETFTIDGVDIDRVYNLKGAEKSGKGFSLISNTFTYDYYVGNCIHVNSTDQLYLNVTITSTTDLGGIAINEVNFPDTYFRTYVKSFDTDKDEVLTRAELLAVTKFDLKNSSAQSFVGIEHFTNLKELDCTYSSVSYIDLRKNVNLVSVLASHCFIDSIDVSTLTQLETLNLNVSGFSTAHPQTISKIDVTNCPELKSLYISYGHFTEIDLSKNRKLEKLDISCDSLKSLDLSALTELKELRYNGELETIDVSKNTNLSSIDIQMSDIKYLDLSKNTKLTWIMTLLCTKLETLILPETENYVNIDCRRCSKLSSLDLSKTPYISKLDISECNFSEIDFTGCKQLASINCSKNKLSWLDLSFNKTNWWSTSEANDNVRDAGKVDAAGFSIEGLDMSRVTVVDGGQIVDGKFVPNKDSQEITYSFETGWSEFPSADFVVSFYTDENPGIAINEETFPDELFRKYVVNNFDTDENGFLRKTEVRNATKIQMKAIWEEAGSFGGGYTMYTKVGLGDMPSSLKGIEYLPYLTYLNIENALFSELDLSVNTQLVNVIIESSRLASLDLSNQTKLDYTKLVGSRVIYDVKASGFVIDGLDMSKVTVTSGGSVVGGAFVPETDNTDVMSYSYDTNNNDQKLNVKLHLVREGDVVTKIDEESFPDDKFRQYVGFQCDKDADGFLTPDEVKGIESLSFRNAGIQDFTGIAALYCLEEFSCNSDNLSTLDLSQNDKLKKVTCVYCQLTEIKLPNNIESINLSANKLDSIDLSGCTKLKYLNVNSNQLTTLDVSKCSELTTVKFSDNKLAFVDFSGFDSIASEGDGQEIEMGMVSSEGFVIEGLDMERVYNVVGGIIVEGKFVPNNVNTTSITYRYQAGNSVFPRSMGVTVNFTVIPGTPINTIIVDEGPAEYYDLQGRRITGPVRGIVIKKQNGRVVKMIEN